MGETLPLVVTLGIPAALLPLDEEGIEYFASQAAELVRQQLAGASRTSERHD